MVMHGCQALEALMPCGAEALDELMKEVLFPAISKAIFDHAASVRKQLVLMLATWFKEIQHVHQYYALLFPLFLSGVVDESPEVHELAVQKMNALAVTWESFENVDDVESMAVDDDVQPPLVFMTRPPLGARHLAKRSARISVFSQHL